MTLLRGSDPKIIRFRKTVEQYCALIENCKGTAKRDFVEQCLRLLVDLFSQSLELNFQNIRGKTPDLPSVSYEEWKVIYRRIEVKLGKHGLYRKVLDPFDPKPPKSNYGSLADDLADTWRDLKDGLLAAKAGKLDEAVWKWRFSFECHWGPNHGAHAFSPLHHLLFGLNEIPVRTSHGKRKRPKAK